MNKLIFLAVFSALAIGTMYFFTKPEDKKQIGIINPAQVNDSLVDQDLQNVGHGHKIGDFSFLNQFGKTITQEEVKGKVHVAEYFFTTCGSICPKMNAQMLRVSKAYAKNNNVKILSFTVDPDVDTVEQMLRYAKELGATSENWHFLTGKKEDLYTLARRSYFVLKPAEVPKTGDGGSDFIHTNNFVLVDQLGRIRKYYDGTNPKEVDELIEDIQVILDEVGGE